MAAGKRRNRGMLFILIAVLAIVIVIAAYVFLSDSFNGGTTATEETVAIATSTPQPADTVPIVVLAQPVKRGNTITEGMIALIPYPLIKMEEGLFITSIDDVIGKRALYDLEARIPLTPSLLTDTEDSSIASFNIPAGHVALSIPIDRLSAVSYALQPGDHVNVIASLFLVDLDVEYQTKLPNLITQVLSPMGSEVTTVQQEEEGAGQESTQFTIENLPLTISVIPPYYGIPYQGRAELEQNLNSIEIGLTEDGDTIDPWMYILPSEASQRPRLVSQTLIQDAIVLWVGEYSLEEEEVEPEPIEIGPTPTPGVVVVDEQEAAAAAAAAKLKPDVITLIVQPQDAVTLNYLMIVGADLNLALRSAGDQSRIQAETVTLQFILEQYNIPVPSKLPYGIEPRTDDFINAIEPTQAPVTGEGGE